MFLKERINVCYFSMFFDGDGIISLMKHRKAVNSEQMDMRLEGKTISFYIYICICWPATISFNWSLDIVNTRCKKSLTYALGIRYVRPI